MPRTPSGASRHLPQFEGGFTCWILRPLAGVPLKLRGMGRRSRPGGDIARPLVPPRAGDDFAKPFSSAKSRP